MLPNYALDLLASGQVRPIAIAVLAVLCRRRNFQTDIVSIGQRELARESGLSEARVAARAIEPLIEHGVLEVLSSSKERGHDRTKYLIRFDVDHAVSRPPLPQDQEKVRNATPSIDDSLVDGVHQSGGREPPVSPVADVSRPPDWCTPSDTYEIKYRTKKKREHRRAGTRVEARPHTRPGLASDARADRGAPRTLQNADSAGSGEVVCGMDVVQFEELIRGHFSHVSRQDVLLAHECLEGYPAEIIVAAVKADRLRQGDKAFRPNPERLVQLAKSLATRGEKSEVRVNGESESERGERVEREHDHRRLQSRNKRLVARLSDGRRGTLVQAALRSLPEEQRRLIHPDRAAHSISVQAAIAEMFLHKRAQDRSFPLRSVTVRAEAS